MSLDPNIVFLHRLASTCSSTSSYIDKDGGSIGFIKRFFFRIFKIKYQDCFLNTYDRLKKLATELKSLKNHEIVAVIDRVSQVAGLINVSDDQRQQISQCLNELKSNVDYEKEKSEFISNNISRLFKLKSKKLKDDLIENSAYILKLSQTNPDQAKKLLDLFLKNLSEFSDFQLYPQGQAETQVAGLKSFFEEIKQFLDVNQKADFQIILGKFGMQIDRKIITDKVLSDLDSQIESAIDKVLQMDTTECHDPRASKILNTLRDEYGLFLPDSRKDAFLQKLATAPPSKQKIKISNNNLREIVRLKRLLKAKLLIKEKFHGQIPRWFHATSGSSAYAILKEQQLAFMNAGHMDPNYTPGAWVSDEYEKTYGSAALVFSTSLENMRDPVYHHSNPGWRGVQASIPTTHLQCIVSGKKIRRQLGTVIPDSVSTMSHNQMRVILSLFYPYRHIISNNLWRYE